MLKPCVQIQWSVLLNWSTFSSGIQVQLAGCMLVGSFFSWVSIASFIDQEFHYTVAD